MILRRGRVVEMGATGRVLGNPLHPYTRALLASVPQLHRKWGRRDEAAEDPPAAGGRLQLVEAEEGHYVASAGHGGEGA